MGFSFIDRDELFPKTRPEGVPSRIRLFSDIRQGDADVQIIIGMHGNPDSVNAVIRNYSQLERKLKLRFIIVNTGLNPFSFRRIASSPEVSRIQVLTPIPVMSRFLGGKRFASNGLGMAFQIGLFFARSETCFVSHTDMMGYKHDFLSYLNSKLSGQTTIASFTQRHLIPFTGCMLFQRSYFKERAVDWLTRENLLFYPSWMKEAGPVADGMDWTDCGEAYIYEALNDRAKMHITASYGITGDAMGEPNQANPLARRNSLGEHAGIVYGTTALTREVFQAKYPELDLPENRCWRKAVDESGDILFIHRGRGGSHRAEYDGRGDFLSFLKSYNAAL